MIRAKVWFRCAAMHDPVMPILVSPAIIGWIGKNRQIDLTIEREFTGSELLKRMKGWITVDAKRAINILEEHGRLKCFDNGELIIEMETEARQKALEHELEAAFQDQCNIEVIPGQNLK